MQIGQLCNRRVVVARRMESAAEIARLMRDEHVGSVVLVDERDGQRVPVGIVTDRDLVLTVVADNRACEATPIGKVMSEDLYCATEEQDVYEVLEQMRARGIRRVPVVDGSRTLQGIFSFDDMVEWTSAQLAEMTRLIQREQRRERDASE
ncbi:MAG: CBS domain-containing protein [Myxococcales bacterium]|nr:CBS domain-containing protein [Myxococcales bacterium]